MATEQTIGNNVQTPPTFSDVERDQCWALARRLMNACSSRRAPSILCPGIVLFAVLLCIPFSCVFAQAAGSDYTKDLPSVERVKTGIKGTDESDTLARQAAVFNYLFNYIQTIKYNRTVSGPYTPGETRMRNAYELAAYQIEQDYKKNHTAPEVKAWSSLEGRYEINDALGWVHQLSGAQANAAYSNAQAGLTQSYKQHEDQMQQQARQAQAGNGGLGPNGMRNDAGSVAARRCLELGGSELQCIGKGLSTGFLDLAGMAHSPLAQGPSYTGLILAGAFKSRNGIDAAFSNTTVSLGNCGKLVIDSRPYTIQIEGSRILVHVKNSPSPFTFALEPDGMLEGPPSAVIDGKVVTGYRKVWVPPTSTPGYYQTQQQTTHREISSQDAEYYGSDRVTNTGEGTADLATTTTKSTYVPGTSSGGYWQSVPIYQAKTQACSVGTLAPGPPAAVEQGGLADIANAAGALFGESANSAGDAGEVRLAPGIRLAGTYTSQGGLKAEFTDASVVLDCGEAHVRDKYTVEREGSRILLQVQNPASPFTVTVEPDGSLSGPASVAVAGRLVSGMNGNDVTYTPHSETCNLGTFTPAKSASTSTTLAASSSAAPRSAPTAEPAPVAASAVPTSVASPTAPLRASLRVLIQAQFAGANPLAGRHVFVMRERLDEILRKLGVPVPSGATPAQAMEALSEACRSRDCKPVYAGLGHYFITYATLDAGGKATLSAHAVTGPYFFFATAHNGKGALLWDIPVNLVAGDNTVTLTAANAEAVGP